MSIVNIPIMLEPRLQGRYCQLVEEHLSPAQRLAAGLRALPGTAKAFASTQAAWRFYRNPRISLPRLARPLLAAAHEAAREQCDDFVLVVHDWSNLHYNHHASKEDRVELSQSTDLGYELQTVLLVSDRNGDPLAPVSQSLRTADGVYCSRQVASRQPLSPLDELAPAMKFVEKQKFGKPAVHIIDAEADSVAHYRDWSQQPGRYFLVRADPEPFAEHEGQDRSLESIRQILHEQGAFRDVREVLYHGKPSRQWVAETQVTLTRPARPQRRGERRRVVPGPPVHLRLVISEVRDEAGNILAVWFLLSNVPETVSADTLALWYYWRWQIESYFKLMKSAGQQLEQWQQDDGKTIAKRVLVASMACVIIWLLMRMDTTEADELRELLIRLSGRQMKRTQPYTAPALLAGMWVLLNVLHVLDHYQPDELRRIAAVLFGARASPHSE